MTLKRKTAHPARKEADRVKHREDLLDEALEESFPASDPPSPAKNGR